MARKSTEKTHEQTRLHIIFEKRISPIWIYFAKLLSSEATSASVFILPTLYNDAMPMMTTCAVNVNKQRHLTSVQYNARRLL
jgi:hypothetical protein